MRAYYTLRELSIHHKITLLVVNDNFNSRDFHIYNKNNFCHRQIIISEKDIFPLLYKVKIITDKISPLLSRILLKRPVDWISGSAKIIKNLKTSLSINTFETIHIFRFRMFPLVKRCLKMGFKGKVNLDLDDIESKTRKRISKLYKANRNLQFLKSFFESEFYRIKEKRLLRNFNKVFVCSLKDKKYLAEKYHLLNVEVANNVIELPLNISDQKLTCPGKKNDYTFMFVGDLLYFPNRDAINYFCSEILPLILKATFKKISIIIIGAGMNNKLRKKLLECKGVQIKGFVKDLSGFYNKADAAIVPLRAGGGTRIKIIEALSYKKPVVSTSIGAEGLCLKDNENILLADTKKDFAEKSLQLINNPEFGKTIGAKGYLAVKKYFSFGVHPRFNP